jgi:hypothetical protein
MTYYRYYSKTAAQHYVYIDGLSDYSDAWMTYYTHKNNTAAPHYVYVDVSSDNPSD